MARRRAQTFAQLLLSTATDKAKTVVQREAEVAQAAGVTIRTLFAWRNGDGIRPHELTVRAVAQALGVDPAVVRAAISASRDAAK